jgi:hypothetical protein
MFNNKKRRIEELEQKLKAAYDTAYSKSYSSIHEDKQVSMRLWSDRFKEKEYEADILIKEKAALQVENKRLMGELRKARNCLIHLEHCTKDITNKISGFKNVIAERNKL